MNGPVPLRPRAGGAGKAAAGRRLAGEFYGLYSHTRLMLVREFEDKGLQRPDAVATAQAFLNRLMLALFVGGRRGAGAGGVGGGIAGVLEGGIGDGTRRVWNHIVGDVFSAPGAGRAHPASGASRGGLFEEPLHESAFFPDKRGAEFFASPGERPASSGRGALPEYRPRIARAVRGAPGLNPVIGEILRLCSYDYRGRIDVDMLGHVFESSVTDLEVLLGRRAAARRQGGIFYTPSYVTDYICSRAIAGYLSPCGRAQDPAGLVAECAENLDDLEERMGDMSILDPACGSGAFLTGAARALIAVHGEIMRRRRGRGEAGGGLDRYVDAGRISGIVRGSVYGIDVNPQSADIARLSLLLLAAADGEDLPDLSGNVVVGNSVAAGPEQGGLDWARAFPAVFAGANPGFSVVVGNPPYVRQEMLGERAKLAMAALPDRSPLKLSRGFRIPKTSDLSAYFYYHSLCRLRRGGRLGFITGDNWLRTEYGRPLRRALLSNARVEALVSPRFKVFHDADVNTVIVMLARMPPAAADRVAFANAASGSDFVEGSLDVAARVLPSEVGDDSWSHYFDMPMPEASFPTVALGEAGRLGRGVTTGCNDFFVLPRGSAWERRLPSSCLRPVVSAGMPPRLEERHATRYVLDVGDGKDILAKTAQGRLAAEYIEHGEAMKVDTKKGGRPARIPLPELPTLAGRRPWYSLSLPPPPPIFIGRIIDRAIRVHENGAGTGREEAYLALDTHLHFTPDAEDHTGAFLAYFASSYFALDMEKIAAPLGGGGLRIDNRVLAKARVPDFGKVPPRSVRKMEVAWSEYCVTMDRKRLDAAVFSALGMARHLDAVKVELDRLVDRRVRTSRQADGGGA